MSKEAFLYGKNYEIIIFSYKFMIQSKNKIIQFEH